MNKKCKVALTLNIVIFLMAVIGSILCFGEIYIVFAKPLEHGIKIIKFFTVQSNILAGISALLYVVVLIRNQNSQKQIPLFINILRYIATIDLILTFLVVALFLGFIVEDGYFSLYVNANFFFHFAIPVINFISFIFFEENHECKFKYTFLGITHVIIYAIFYMSVVLSHFENGAVDIKYDWYAFAQLGLPVAFVCFVVVLVISYLSAFLLYKVINKFQSREQQPCT